MAQYWLFKSEPDVFSIQDLASAPKKQTCWEGVRNYQARNFLRDQVAVGDGVLYYHSNAALMGIAGTATVVRAAYPDSFAFDSGSPYFDARSDPDSPAWYMVDIRLTRIFDQLVTRDDLKQDPVTTGMMVMQRGSRLSIQPVTKDQWDAVHRLAGVADTGRRVRRS